MADPTPLVAYVGALGYGCDGAVCKGKLRTEEPLLGYGGLLYWLVGGGRCDWPDGGLGVG